jgi:predicted amino acid-binding ACT domain protein
MHINTLEDGRIQINFTKTSNNYSFSDALYFTQEEYEALTEVEIKDMMQKRFDNWFTIITYVDPAEDPAEREAKRIENQIAELAKTAEDIDAEIAAINLANEEKRLARQAAEMIEIERIEAELAELANSDAV